MHVKAFSHALHNSRVHNSVRQLPAPLRVPYIYVCINSSSKQRAEHVVWSVRKGTTVSADACAFTIAVCSGVCRTSESQMYFASWSCMSILTPYTPAVFRAVATAFACDVCSGVYRVSDHVPCALVYVGCQIIWIILLFGSVCKYMCILTPYTPAVSRAAVGEKMLEAVSVYVLKYIYIYLCYVSYIHIHM